jgi:hypothetical protein
MVQHDVGQMKETILVTGKSKKLLHFCDSAVFLNNLGVIEHAWLITELILNRVGRIAVASFLERCPV